MGMFRKPLAPLPGCTAEGGCARAHMLCSSTSLYAQIFPEGTGNLTSHLWPAESVGESRETDHSQLGRKLAGHFVLTMQTGN